METWQAEKKESENRKKAALITLLLNLLLLLAIYFIIVWREHIPPLPKYGMELNLGFSDTGSGNRQTSVPPTESPSTSDVSPAPGDQSPEPTESSVPITQPKTEAAKPTSSPAQPAYEAPAKTTSPVKGSENPKPAVKEPSPVKKEETANKQAAKAESETTTTKAEEKPKIDQRAIFGSGGTSGTGNKSAASSAQGTSNKAGDEGKPTGTVDGRAIMGSGTGSGNPGPASGVGLDLAGWEFATQPVIRDNVSTRNGTIVFKITVDDAGKIIQALPENYNVSNEVLAYYRTVVNQIKFKRQGGNATADFSTGKITFIIKVD